MAEKEIIQNMIRQLGQSQDDRLPDELGIHFADVDELKTEDLLLFTKTFAGMVKFYRDDLSPTAKRWTGFFPYDEGSVKTWLESRGADTPPHLALLLSFLELYKKPQELLNRFTGRHLDFYFHDVLRLHKKPAVPDKAHVVLELKKQAPPTVISPANVFSAGKHGKGVELLYTPAGETVINGSVVDSLRSIYLDPAGHGTIRYAPVANSSDGLGGDLDSAEPKWPGFGRADLPAAEVGFAIASPVLRMKEGTRKVIVKLTLSNVDSTKLNTTALAGAFNVFVTGEKNWQGPYSVSPTLSGGTLQFDFTVPATEKAVIDYDAAIHGYSYVTQAPVVQLLLNAGNPNIGYYDFSGVTVQKAQVSVDVSGVTSLTLESDGGTLDPQKPFLPFGPQPTAGSRFMVGFDEALSKKLSTLSIKVQWKDAPRSFSSYYSGYGGPNSNDSFTAGVSFTDGGSWEYSGRTVPLFESADAGADHTFAFTPGSASASPPMSKGMSIYALSASGSLWGRATAHRLVLRSPVLSAFRRRAPEPRSGFVTFSLETNFLHAAYRKKYVENVMAFTKGTATSLTLLNEPYTPAIQSVSLSYKANSDDVAISSEVPEDFSNPDIQFFHIAYFGQMREHGYQRKQFSFLADKTVALLPAYLNEGELLIGFRNLSARDSVSVLFQVAEGSADPDLEQENINWSILCDNYWKPLGTDGVVLDTTNQLLASGVVRFVVPAEATTQNTILPADRIWLRAGMARNIGAICQLIAVSANAVEVRFSDQGNDPNHLTVALEAGNIAKLKNGLAGIKSAAQPFASFGGVPEETDDYFRRRVSERLRHKDRCITPWDYERIILETFPGVHKAKCIPHAKEGSWLAPGNVMIVVVPDLRNKNALDSLQPKVDADTISRITQWVQQRIGMQVRVKVKNPSYRKIQLDFKVRFHTGYEFNYYSGQLKQRLIEFLSPWAFSSERDISFGGRIYKSVLLDFVEDLPEVDYVTDFKMYSYNGSGVKTNLNEVQPDAPDTILVSDHTHAVAEVPR
jgi:hypothetical protein